MSGPTTCQPALQQAIYGRLTGDAALSAVITGVFDEVSKDQQTPYIVLAEVLETAAEAHDRAGIDASIVIDMWSRYRGYAEVASINAMVNRLLHRPVDALEVAGFQHVTIKSSTNHFLRDPDPDLRRCSTRYLVWLEALPQ